MDNSVDHLTSLLEPIIMSVLGNLVGGLLIAMYMPIFQLGNVVFPESSGSGVQKAPKLVLGVGSPNPGESGKPLRFDNPNSIAGILLRRYGGFAVLELEDFE